MDLRVVKTKKVIKEAFLELRKKYPLEKVKLKDVCDLALINKTTFYRYYTDIFDLSEELEQEAMEQYFKASRDADCLFSAPEKFLAGIPQRVDENMEEIFLLFSGREDILLKKMEDYLLGLYRKEDMSPEDTVLLHFVIFGAVHTMQKFASGDEEHDKEITRNIANVIKKVMT